MKLLAIDPGNIESAYVLYDSEAARPLRFAKLPNHDLLALFDEDLEIGAADSFAVEMIASYGMPVGAEVFETCVWIGRFVERYSREEATRLVYRREVKWHLCGEFYRKAKDAHVRQALLDKFGPGRELAIGKKASPGPLYGLTGDCWAALGVAVTAAETALVAV